MKNSVNETAKLIPTANIKYMKLFSALQMYSGRNKK